MKLDPEERPELLGNASGPRGAGEGRERSAGAHPISQRVDRALGRALERRAEQEDELERLVRDGEGRHLGRRDAAQLRLARGALVRRAHLELPRDVALQRGEVDARLPDHEHAERPRLGQGHVGGEGLPEVMSPERCVELAPTFGLHGERVFPPRARPAGDLEGHPVGDGILRCRRDAAHDHLAAEVGAAVPHAYPEEAPAVVLRDAREAEAALHVAFIDHGMRNLGLPGAARGREQGAERREPSRPALQGSKDPGHDGQAKRPSIKGRVEVKSHSRRLFHP